MEKLTVKLEGRTVALRMPSSSTFSSVVSEACRIFGLSTDSMELFTADGPLSKPVYLSAPVGAESSRVFNLTKTTQQYAARARMKSSLEVAGAHLQQSSQNSHRRSTSASEVKSGGRSSLTGKAPLPDISIRDGAKGDKKIDTATSASTNDSVAAGISVQTPPMLERIAGYVARDPSALLAFSKILLQHIMKSAEMNAYIRFLQSQFAKICLRIAERAPSAVPRPALVCPGLPIRVVINLIGTVSQATATKFLPTLASLTAKNTTSTAINAGNVNNAAAKGAQTGESKQASLLAASRLRMLMGIATQKVFNAADNTAFYGNSASNVTEIVPDTVFVGFPQALVVLTAVVLEICVLMRELGSARGLPEVELMFTLSNVYAEIFTHSLTLVKVRLQQIELDVIRRLQADEVAFLGIPTASLLPCSYASAHLPHRNISDFMSSCASILPKEALSTASCWLLLSGEEADVSSVSAACAACFVAYADFPVHVADSVSLHRSMIDTVSFHRFMTCMADAGVVKLLALKFHQWVACWQQVLGETQREEPNEVAAPRWMMTSLSASQAVDVFALACTVAAAAMLNRALTGLLEEPAVAAAVQAGVVNADERMHAVLHSMLQCSQTPALLQQLEVAVQPTCRARVSAACTFMAHITACHAQSDMVADVVCTVFFAALAHSFLIFGLQSMAEAFGPNYSSNKSLHESRPGETAARSRWPSPGLETAGTQLADAVAALSNKSASPMATAGTQSLAVLAAKFSLCLPDCTMPALSVQTAAASTSSAHSTTTSELEAAFKEAICMPSMLGSVSAALLVADKWNLPRRGENMSAPAMRFEEVPDKYFQRACGEFSAISGMLNNLLSLQVAAPSPLARGPSPAPPAAVRHSRAASSPQYFQRHASSSFVAAVPSSLVQDIQHNVSCHRVRALPTFTSAALMKTNNGVARTIASVRRGLMFSSLSRNVLHRRIASGSSMQDALEEMLSEVSGRQIHNNVVLGRYAPLLAKDIYTTVELSGAEIYSVCVSPDLLTFVRNSVSAIAQPSLAAESDASISRGSSSAGSRLTDSPFVHRSSRAPASSMGEDAIGRGRAQQIDEFQLEAEINDILGEISTQPARTRASAVSDAGLDAESLQIDATVETPLAESGQLSSRDKKLLAKLRKVCGWLAPSHALGRLERVLAAVTNAKERIIDAMRTQYAWDFPLPNHLSDEIVEAMIDAGWCGDTDFTQLGDDISSLQPLGCHNAADIVQHMKFADCVAIPLERLTWSQAGPVTSMKYDEPSARAAIAWTEYHLAVLFDLEAECLLEIQHWTAMTEDLLATQAVVSKSASPEPIKSQLNCQISQDATDVEVDSFAGNGQEIDNVLTAACQHFERCLAVRPNWPAACDGLSKTLARRAMLCYSVLVQATGDSRVGSDMALPFKAPDKILQQAEDARGMVLHAAAYRRLPAFFHSRASSMALLHGSLLSSSDKLMAEAFSSFVAIRGVLMTTAPVIPETVSATPTHGDAMSEAARTVRLVTTGWAAASSGTTAECVWAHRLVLPTYMPSSFTKYTGQEAGANSFGVCTLSPLGAAAAFKIFSDLDGDADGWLRGPELIRLFLECGMIELSPNPDIARLSKKASQLLAWFSHNFSCGYIASDLDPFAQLTVSSGARAGDDGSPDQPVRSSVVVAAWPVTASSTRYCIKAYEQHDNIPVQDYVFATFERLYSLHVAGAIPMCGRSHRRPPWRNRAVPNYVLDLLPTNQADEPPVTSGGMRSKTGQSGFHYSRRLPSYTRSPLQTFSAASVAVTFPAFCEFFVWLLSTDPIRIVSLLQAFSVLEDPAEVSAGGSPLPSSSRNVDQQSGPLIGEQSSSLSEGDGSVLIHSGGESEGELSTSGGFVADDAIPKWLDNVHINLAWSASTFVPVVEDKDKAISGNNSTHSGSTYETGAHSRDDETVTSCSGSSGEDGPHSNGARPTNLLVESLHRKGRSHGSDGPLPHEPPTKFSAFSWSLRKSRSRSETASSLESDLSPTTPSRQRPGFSRVKRRQRSGTGTSTSKSTPRMGGDFGRRYSATSSRTSGSAGSASAIKLSKLKANSSSLGFNLFSGAPTPSLNSSTMTPSQLKSQIAARRKVAEQLLRKAGLSPRGHAQDDSPRTPSLNLSNVTPLNVGEITSPAPASFDPSWLLRYFDAQYDYGDDDDEDLVPMQIDPLEEARRPKGGLKKLSTSDVGDDRPIVVHKNGSITFNVNMQELIKEKTEEAIPPVSKSFITGLANTYRLDANQMRSLYAALSLQRHQNRRRDRLALSSTSRSRLFDYFVVVGRGDIVQHDPDIPLEMQLADTTGPEDLEFHPTVFDRVPTEDWPGTSMPANVSGFVFPTGLALSPVKLPTRYFNFVLTSESGTKLYCCAMTRWEKMDTLDVISMFATQVDGDTKASLALPPWVDLTMMNSPDWICARLYSPKAFVLISHHPVFSAMKNSLAQVLRLSLSTELPLPLDKYLSHLIYDIPLPPRGMVSTGFTIGDKHVIVARPPPNEFPLLDVPLSPLFQCLDLNSLLLVFTAMLCERRICICSKYLHLLTPITEALVSLLYPFKWVVNYIPVLPRNHRDIIGAPTPYIIGWCGDMREAQPYSTDAVFVDIDANVVYTPNNEPLPKLPELQRKKLAQSLKEHAYGSGITSSGGMLGMFGGRPTPAGKLYGADFNPELKTKLLTTMNRAFASDDASPNDEVIPSVSVAAASAFSPISAADSIMKGTTKDVTAHQTPVSASVRAPWAKKRNSHHFSASLDLRSIEERLDVGGSAAARSTSAKDEASLDALSSLAFGWQWSSFGSDMGFPASADFPIPEMKSPSGPLLDTAKNPVAVSTKSAGSGPVSPSQDTFRTYGNVSLDIPIEMEGEITASSFMPSTVPTAAAGSPDSGSEDGRTVLPTSPITGLTPAFSAYNIRSAFVQFFINVFKHYRDYVVYEKVGVHSAEYAEKQVLGLLQRAANRRVMSSSLGLRTDPDKLSENAHFSGESEASSPAADPSSGDAAAGRTAKPAKTESVGFPLPPIPIPAVRAIFNIDAFLFDHAASRDLLRIMNETQLFMTFVRSLVPLIYSFDPMRSPPPYEALPAPQTFKPTSEDPAFFDRLPPSVRFFNASINAKLNRVAANRMSVPGFRPRWTKLDTAFLDDISYRIQKHIVVPPPLPLGLSKEMANILSKIDAIRPPSTAGLHTPGAASHHGRKPTSHATAARGRALSVSLDAVAAAALASAGVTSSRLSSARDEAGTVQTEVQAKRQRRRHERRRLRYKSNRHGNRHNGEGATSPLGFAADASHVRTASNGSSGVASRDSRHRRNASNESLNAVARQVANSASKHVSRPSTLPSNIDFTALSTTPALLPRSVEKPLSASIRRPADAEALASRPPRPVK